MLEEVKQAGTRRSALAVVAMDGCTSGLQQVRSKITREYLQGRMTERFAGLPLSAFTRTRYARSFRISLLCTRDLGKDSLWRMEKT
jgi:hypothetical protein